MKFSQINLFKSENYRQLIAAVIINLSTVIVSIMMSWTSPAIPQLMDKNPPVGTEPMTISQISWIGSILPLVGLVTLLCSAWSAELLGRKITGCILTIPALLSWILTYYAQDFMQLLISRILAALALGITHGLVPVYVNEIADKSVRGQLGSFGTFANNIGTLITFIMGGALSYHNFALCAMPLPVIFLILFAFMPETPPYLVRKKRIQQASRSLMWLRNGNKTIVEHEVNELQNVIVKGAEGSKTNNFRALFRDRGTRKGFIIAMSLLSGQHLAGLSIVTLYTNFIFERANVVMSSYVLAIIVGVVQIIGSMLSTITIDRLGRRILLIASCSAMLACHIMLGLFFLVQRLHLDLSSFSWIPLVSLSAFVFMYSVGLGPCSHVVVTEVLSPDIASLGVSITMSAGFIVSFITSKAFPLIVDEFGDETAFFILAIFCGAILCLVYFYIPETKGKSMAAILKELNGEQISDNVVYNNSVNTTANVAIEEVVRLPRN